MTRQYSSISVETTLASGISSTATSMTVAAGTGSTLMGGVSLAAGNVDQFTVAIDPDTINEEIVFITQVSTDTFTIVRGQAGTSNITHSGGATVRHVLTSSDLNFYTAGVATADGAVQKSVATNKGDLLVATSSATIARQGVGTNGQVLTADSTLTNGIKWASVATTPRIGQVVSATSNTQTDTTSTSLVDCTGITASITPTLSTSKVLVTIDCDVQVDGNPANTIFGRVAIVKGSTVLTQSRTLFYNYNSTVNGTLMQRVSISYLDSPATTSSTTYKLQMAAGASTTMSTNAYGYYATVTLQEVLV
jgi:hypothetical protein